MIFFNINSFNNRGILLYLDKTVAGRRKRPFTYRYVAPTAKLPALPTKRKAHLSWFSRSVVWRWHIYKGLTSPTSPNWLYNETLLKQYGYTGLGIIDGEKYTHGLIRSQTITIEWMAEKLAIQWTSLVTNSDVWGKWMAQTCGAECWEKHCPFKW